MKRLPTLSLLALALLCPAMAKAQTSTNNGGLVVNTGALIVQGIEGQSWAVANGYTTTTGGFVDAAYANLISTSIGFSTLQGVSTAGAIYGAGATGSINVPGTLFSISWTYVVNTTGEIILTYMVNVPSHANSGAIDANNKAALINGNAPAAGAPKKVNSSPTASSYGGTAGYTYTVTVWTETGHWDGVSYTVTASSEDFSYFIPGGSYNQPGNPTHPLQ